MSSENPAPLSKASFIIFITSFLFFYEFALGNIYDSFGPYIGPAFHLSPALLGFVASLYFYTDLIFLIPAGIIIDRHSPRITICTVLFISSTGVVLTAFTHSLAALIFLRLLMGFGGGFCLVGCIRIAVNWFHPLYMARVSGFIITMGMLGGFLVQTPLTVLIHQIGWREAMLVLGLIGYGCTALIFLLVRDAPAGHEAASHTRKMLHVKTGAYGCLKLALSEKQNWFCGLYTGLINLPIYMLGALWGIPYLRDFHHMSVTHAATVSGMLYMGTMIGSPLMGLISDKANRRRLPMQIAALASLVLIFAIILIPTDSFSILLTLFLLLGVTTSSQIISYPTVVESNPRVVSASATCIISMMCMGGGALIQPLFGYLLTWKGYQFAMYALPVAFVMALFFSLFIRETYCQNLEK